MADTDIDKPEASRGMKLLERAFAVCYTGKTYRADRLAPELKRVGCREVTPIWDFPSPYKGFLLSKIRHIRDLDTHPGTWGATLGNYRAIKTAYGLGLPHALIVEDDCRFLEDLSVVEKTLDAAPADWDVLMLDHFCDADLKPPVDGWSRCDSAKSTACYIVNRRAMERLIDMYESPVSGKYPHPNMRVCDHWLDTRYLGKDTAIYCSCPNLAIQCDCGDTTCWNAKPGNAVQKTLYAKMGLDLTKYREY